MSFSVVDAFTTDAFQGNPAAVVLESKDLPDEKLQLLAREIGLSETVFALPPTTPDADVRIRWFTPTVEVPLCGHATIACFARMAELGRLPKPALRVETAVGILAVVVDGPTVWFSLPLPTFSYWRADKRKLAHALGISEESIDSQAPAMTDGRYGYLPLRRMDVLKSFMIRSDELRSVLDKLCLTVFTMETIDEKSDWHMRFFAPRLGVPEDPVTGSANGPLGVYFHSHLGIQKREYIGEQGDIMGRRGRVRVRLAMEGEAISNVAIGGTAVTVMEGTIKMP